MNEVTFPHEITKREITDEFELLGPNRVAAGIAEPFQSPGLRPRGMHNCFIGRAFLQDSMRTLSPRQLEVIPPREQLWLAYRIGKDFLHDRRSLIEAMYESGCPEIRDRLYSWASEWLEQNRVPQEPKALTHAEL